jgi:cytochrome c553
MMLAIFMLFCRPPHAWADGLGDEHAPPQEICGTCHGLNGISRMAKFPKLAGQRAEYLEKQIRDFREGRRGNDGGQMATAATEIREDQVTEVARYFAAQPPPEPQVLALEVSGNGRAETLFNVGDVRAGITPCGDCHAPAARFGAARIVGPLLSSQHESYIAKQLRDFRSGARDNDTEGVMQRIARRLGDNDIAALARYLALMPREAKTHE